MSVADTLPMVGFEDYLAAEQTAARPREWVAGRVFAMTGGTERRDLMAGLVYQALLAAPGSAGCRVFIHNRMVRLGEAAYYPDVLVVCPGGPAPDRLYERDLCLVAEVSSASTVAVDRREKALVYAAAPAFTAYLLVDPDRRRVEVAERGPGGLRWRTLGAGGRVPHLEVDLDDIYDRLDALAVTR